MNSSLEVILFALAVINMVAVIFCLYMLHTIKSRFFDIIKHCTAVNESHLDTLKDLKHILIKAFNIKEMPRPGKFQTKIKPTFHTNEELYDMERK